MDDKLNADGADSVQRASTGIPGLDEVLLGGFLAENVYLIQGNPGSGKNHAGNAVPHGGRQTRRTGLYVTLSESKKDIQPSPNLTVVNGRHCPLCGSR